MITYWTTHEQYLNLFTTELKKLWKTDLNRIESFADSIEKLSTLNHDLLFETLKPYYYTIGRHAKHSSSYGVKVCDCRKNRMTPLQGINI